jgi:hypothetical protein
VAARKGKTEALETVHDSELVARPQKDAVTRRREQEEALGGIKNKIFGDSMRVVEDFLRARDIDPLLNKEEDPAYYRMMTELGDEEEVRKAYALARAGWLPGSETPAFVKVATQMATGIMKAQAAEKGGTKILNVGKVHIDASLIPAYDEIEVE